MHNRPEATLHVTHRTGADSGTLCQLLLRQSGRQAELLKGDA